VTVKNLEIVMWTYKFLRHTYKFEIFCNRGGKGYDPAKMLVYKYMKKRQSISSCFIVRILGKIIK